MPEIASSTTRALSRPFLLTGAAVALILVATLALWAHYGSAVFFEVIRTGFATCF